MISNLVAQNLGNIKRQNGGGIQFQSKLNDGSSFSFIISDYTVIMDRKN
jgi:hypothetical protein